MTENNELKSLISTLQYSFDDNKNISVTKKSYEKFSNNEDYIFILYSSNSYAIPIKIKSYFLKSIENKEQYFVSYSINGIVKETAANNIKIAKIKDDKKHIRQLRKYFDLYEGLKTSSPDKQNIGLKNEVNQDAKSISTQSSDLNNTVFSLQSNVNQIEKQLIDIKNRKDEINSKYNNLINNRKFESLDWDDNFIKCILFSAYPLWKITDSFTDNIYIHIAIILIPNLFVFLNIAYHLWFKLQNIVFPIIFFGNMIYNTIESKNSYEICLYSHIGLYIFFLYSIYQHYLNIIGQNEFISISNKETQLKSQLESKKNELTKEKWRITPPNEKAKVKLEAINDAVWNNNPSKAEKIYYEWENEIQKYFGQNTCQNLRNSIKQEWEIIKFKKEEARKEQEERNSTLIIVICRICGRSVEKIDDGVYPPSGKCDMNFKNGSYNGHEWKIMGRKKAF
jgi:hypothetical protein